MKFNKEQDYWATCYFTNEFLLIETQSGLGRTSADPLFPPHLLLPEADDEYVGETILQALSNSRTLNNLEGRVAFLTLRKARRSMRLGLPC